jgi:hypothetical protein
VKNLISISTLEDPGFRVDFFDGQVLLWTKGSSIDSATVIGVREGGLYKLKEHLEQALVHNSIIALISYGTEDLLTSTTEPYQF